MRTQTGGIIFLLFPGLSLSLRDASRLLTVRKDNPLAAQSFASSLLSAAMKSPLYEPLAKAARNTIKKSVENFGVGWDDLIVQIEASNDWESAVEEVIAEKPDLKYEDYYLQRFHTYSSGKSKANPFPL